MNLLIMTYAQIKKVPLAFSCFAYVHISALMHFQFSFYLKYLLDLEEGTVSSRLVSSKLQHFLLGLCCQIQKTALLALLDSHEKFIES